MTITVGTDSYVTVAEADAHIAEYYASTDIQRLAWEALSTADKETYLRTATRSIGRIPVIGRKYDDAQDLAFPRSIHLPLPNRRHRNYKEIFNQDKSPLLDAYFSEDMQLWRGDGEVPADVESAQIEEALEGASPSTDTTDFDVDMSNVKSYRVGGQISETFRAPADNQRRTVTNGASMYLKSQEAQDYISPFLGGGFRVR